MYFVYILTNVRHTVFYTGVTNDLVRRVHEHKQKLIEGFTKRYNITEVVYFEEHEDIQNAILREKVIKGWRREKKLDLIRKENPEMQDLYLTLF